VVVTLGAGRVGNLAHGIYHRIRKNCADQRAARIAHVA
jgi:hypothetical protein